ncbi:Preprotein translocase subunit SecY [Vibrio sp. SM6]|uniref:Preprotein translocase subunit SecY n=1 Tax=Vibrio agarilyticus TaxID=2726741 RepID=A0A7X8TUE6_9VIBR|nr:bZIP transcription factor [Vibrio agarilyticus]NLS14821.1 Preprotein translocase subunit SecY [Vibrio agarilyticus]
MQYQHQLNYRYPKGRFAMMSVYSFTGAAILASTIFSLLLFLSIDDNPMMQALFGGLAIIFEAGKFYAWYEFGERRAHRNYSGALVAVLFYLVLAVISIGGSIGGINSATNTAQSHIAVEQAKIAAFDQQINAIENQIELNNLAAQKYIEMERIATGVSRIQEQNNKLRQEQQRLAMERDSLPPVSQGSVIGLIDSLAGAFAISSAQAQLGLVVFLSILLDFFAAFFVGLIGEEQRFRHFYRLHAPASKADDPVIEPAGYLPHLDAQANYPVSHSEVNPVSEPLSIKDQVIQALRQNQVACTKRAVAKQFELSSDAVDGIFDDLVMQGCIGKKANNHYHWLMQASQ